MDVSSITLRFRDRDILVDSGSYNYDMADPMRRCLQSTRGHSGVYLDEADAVLPPYRVRNFPFDARIEAFDENAERARVRCSYRYRREDGTIAEAVRRIVFFWSGVLVVSDRVACREPVNVRQSFIFSPEAAVERDGLQATIANGDVHAELLHVSPSAPDWYHGETEPVVRGWYSDAPSKALPCSGVDFRQQGARTEFLTAIRLEGADWRIADWSAAWADWDADSRADA